MKILAACFLVGTTCVALGYARLALVPPAGTPATGDAAAPRPAVDAAADWVAALGRLEPEGGVIAVAGPPGARIAGLAVREGEAVRRGQVLATLEGRAALLAERAHLEAQVREAGARLKAEDAYEAALKAEAEVGRREVRELDVLEIKAQEARLGAVRAALANSMRTLDRLDGLRAAAAVSPQESDQARLLVRRDREELAAAEALLEKLRKGHGLHGERVEVELRKATAGADRLRAAVPRESLDRGLALIDAKLAEAEVRAPIDGRVLKVLARPGEATGARPILQLGDADAMGAVAEVYETDRRRVAEGMRAEVASPALPDGRTRLRGAVERIGWTVAKNDVLGLDPAADAFARVVEVRIRLDPEDARAVRHLTNLQVEVRIDTRTGPAAGGRRR